MTRLDLGAQRVIGVDPGPARGAAVLLSGGGWRWVAWEHQGRGARRTLAVMSATDAGTSITGSASRHDGCPAEDRLWLLDEAPTCAAVEVVHAGRVRGRDVVRLAEDAGTWIGVLRACGVEPMRVDAQDWRLALGIARGTPARVADAMARRLLVERHGLTWLADEAVPGHVVDAAGIAVWAAQHADEGA